MTIENHVVSLQTAKRMRKLKWRKKTVFYWAMQLKQDSDGDYSFSGEHALHPVGTTASFLDKDYFAPLATELLEELPMEIKAGSKNETAYLVIYPGAMNSVHYEEYDCGESWNFFSWEHETSLAEALALLWCELKEKGII